MRSFSVNEYLTLPLKEEHRSIMLFANAFVMGVVKDIARSYAAIFAVRSY